MRICEVREKSICGKWIADWSKVGNCNYSNLDEVIQTHRPVLQFSLFEDATYRQLMDIMKSVQGDELVTHRYRDNDYIRHPVPIEYSNRGMRERASNLRGIDYKGFDQDTMIFWVTSEIQWTGIIYTCRIRFLLWDEIGGDPDMTPREKALRILNESPLQLDCDDPSFLYWGYEFVLTQMNAAIEPESRPPNKNNPHQLGLVCKHLHRVLRSLPFYNGDIAKAITQQWGGKISKREIDAIRRRYDLAQQANVGMPAEIQEPPPEEAEPGNAGLPPEEDENEIQRPDNNTI
jgi:hypothetical protein